jgi:hypothetical protein
VTQERSRGLGIGGQPVEQVPEGDHPDHRPRSITGAPDTLVRSRRRTATSAGVSASRSTTSLVMAWPTVPSRRSRSASGNVVIAVASSTLKGGSHLHPQHPSPTRSRHRPLAPPGPTTKDPAGLAAQGVPVPRGASRAGWRSLAQKPAGESWTQGGDEECGGGPI